MKEENNPIEILKKLKNKNQTIMLLIHFIFNLLIFTNTGIFFRKAFCRCCSSEHASTCVESSPLSKEQDLVGAKVLCKKCAGQI